MKAAYFHPDNTKRSTSVKTPMRGVLDKARIDVVDVAANSAGGRDDSWTGDRDMRDAELMDVTIKQACDIDVWISEACATGETDQLGPCACKELGIPLVVLEPDTRIASNDHRDAALQIVGQADHIVTTSSNTARYFERLKPDGITLLPTFVDVDPFRAAYKVRELHRSRLAARLRLPETSPWLLTDGAMETRDSRRSYEVLSVALSRLVMMDWQLIVITTGNAVAEVKKLLLRLPRDRTRYCDRMTLPDFAALCVSCDMYVWPAMGDSSPGSLLEVQSSGLPVVAGRKDSTEDRVVDGRTGRLTPIGNAESFAGAIRFLLSHPDFRQSFSDDARDIASTQHDSGAAATRLGKILSDLSSRRS